MNASTKLHCNTCLGLRSHLILFETTREYVDDSDDGPTYDERTLYRLAECAGCETVTLHTTWRSSSQPDPIQEQWPPKVSRRTPKWLLELFLHDNLSNPFKYEFFREIYSALKSGNRRLAVLGVRALLEQVMLEHIKDQGTFAKNLSEFQAAGFMSRVQCEAIGPVIEAGHASMHRGFRATEQQIEAILDVTENVIESIYITKQRSNGLDVPPRKPGK